MPIMLKEFCGVHNILNSNEPQTKDFNLKEGVLNFLAPKPDTLMVEIEGIHSAPFRTRNNTRYMPEALQKSQRAWTFPFAKPALLHHNDRDGRIVGRILDAKYTEKSMVDGSGALLFTVNIPDKEAAEQVENGLLSTVSIGVSADDVRCSICGKKITDASEGCPDGHERGNTYDGEVCCWDVYSLDPKELSYVIVPSDIYASNRKIYRANDKNINDIIIRHSELDNSADKDIRLKEAENKTIDGEKPNMDLEKQLADAQARVGELEKELAKANEALKDLEELKKIKAEHEEQNKKLAEIQALLDDKNKELEDEKAKVAVSEENLKTITQEKESAEKAGLEIQESFKSFAAEILNQYRAFAKKREFKAEELKERSMDSIMNSISDLQEELNVKDEKKIDMQEANKTPNPVAPLNDKPTKTEPNKDYTVVNLSEGLEALFAQAARL